VEHRRAQSVLVTVPLRICERLNHRTVHASCSFSSSLNESWCEHESKELLTIHPIEFLAEISGLSQAELARAIGVSPMRISHAIKG
jgi:hypothetical protein